MAAWPPPREKRYANIQEVLDALTARDVLPRRPLVMLGFVGPALLLGVMSVFAWSSFETVMGESDEPLRTQVLDINKFAAKSVAKTVTNELERRYRAVEEMAASPCFKKCSKPRWPIPKWPSCAGSSKIRA